MCFIALPVIIAHVFLELVAFHEDVGTFIARENFVSMLSALVLSERLDAVENLFAKVAGELGLFPLMSSDVSNVGSFTLECNVAYLTRPFDELASFSLPSVRFDVRK